MVRRSRTVYNPYSLAGKTILVTGASSGIGRETALECSRLGARTIITGRNAGRLQETFERLEGDGHQQVVADLTVEEDVRRLAGEGPRLGGVVLCAGKGLTLPFLYCTREKFDEMFGVNYFAPVELLRLLVRMKRFENDASAVFVASIGGVNVFGGANAIYGATKAAMVSTVKYCALELAPKKIRVNAVNPGMVDTPLIHRGQITEAQMQENAKAYPLRRYGTPADIAHGIVYLLSDASSWVTGQSLVIDGGCSI